MVEIFFVIGVTFIVLYSALTVIVHVLSWGVIWDAIRNKRLALSVIKSTVVNKVTLPWVVWYVVYILSIINLKRYKLPIIQMTFCMLGLGFSTYLLVLYLDSYVKFAIDVDKFLGGKK